MRNAGGIVAVVLPDAQFFLDLQYFRRLDTVQGAQLRYGGRMLAGDLGKRVALFHVVVLTGRCVGRSVRGNFRRVVAVFLAGQEAGRPLRRDPDFAAPVVAIDRPVETQAAVVGIDEQRRVCLLYTSRCV